MPPHEDIHRYTLSIYNSASYLSACMTGSIDERTMNAIFIVLRDIRTTPYTHDCISCDAALMLGNLGSIVVLTPIGEIAARTDDLFAAGLCHGCMQPPETLLQRVMDSIRREVFPSAEFASVSVAGHA